MINRVFKYVLLIALVQIHTAANAESLYSESTFRPLASDKRAHLPGDALTVMIYETSSATTSADTSLQKKNEIGVQAGINQRNPQKGSIATNTNFDGGGTVQRSGKLLAQMTVTVTKVAENGDLWVSGQQLLEINSDKQMIKIEGRVRTLDISDTNTVLSYRLAQAKVSYVGEGALSDHQRPGYISRFFSWIGL
jgi:flagellar L-ring protein FlgH